MQSHWPGSGETTSSREEDPGFVADLGRSLAVWRRHPMLPLTTLAVAGLTAVPSDDASGIIAFVAGLFSVGWVGTQRIWYLRAFRGIAMRPWDVWALSWRFFGRFLLFVILALVALGGIFWLVGGLERSAASSSRIVLYMTPILVLGEVAATFVIPALSYSTRSLRTAVREGLAMLRSEWPACLWYALAPPVTAAAAGFGLLEPAVGTIAAAAISLTVGNLLNLWFKGAISLFYLRRNPWVPDDGAARS